MTNLKPALLTVVSSLIASGLYYLLSACGVFTNDTILIIPDIIAVLLTLIINFIFGYFFASAKKKSGYFIQFFILLIIAAFTMAFDDDSNYIFFSGSILNPLYAHIRFAIWQINSALSDKLLLKCLIALLSAFLPSILMFAGAKAAALRNKKH